MLLAADIRNGHTVLGLLDPAGPSVVSTGRHAPLVSAERRCFTE